MSEYGSGLALDGDWDLVVDESSGDIARETDVAELEKDLSFNLARAFDDQAVGYATAGQQADIRLLAKRVVEADPRVASVSNVVVDIGPRNDTLSVLIDIQPADDTQFSLEVEL